MKTKGRFYSVSRDMDGGLILSFRVYEEKKVLPRLEEIRDEPTIHIEVAKVKKTRSLSANALYWLFVGKLAAKLRVSTNRVHNILLRRYGALKTVDGEELICFVPDTDEAEEMALEAETFHIKPTSATKVFKNGTTKRMYKILKGSHEYNTQEMSVLINGLMDECNHVGIPTASPEEVKEVMERYAKHHPDGM